MLHRRLLFLLVPALIGVPGMCQPVISGHSGLILFSEGSVLVDGAPLIVSPGRFPELKEGSTLTTGSGRVEMLLSPSVLLSLGGNSAARMIQNSLYDVQIALLEGSAIVKSTEANANNLVTMLFQERRIRLLAIGSYRIDSELFQLGVNAGQVEVESDGNKVVVGAGSLLSFKTGAISERVAYRSDALDRWSKQRSKAEHIGDAQSARGSEQNSTLKKVRALMFPRTRPPTPARTW